jgi:hypothetical protein
MVKKFERKDKYLVLKQDDIKGALSTLEKASLDSICISIGYYRKQLHKEQNKYVVVNQDEPYAEIVWKLIELSQTHPEHMKALIDNIQLEFDMEEHLGDAYL